MAQELAYTTPDDIGCLQKVFKKMDWNFDDRSYGGHFVDS